ncbi:MAG: ribonuclease H family protein [Bacteroidales bacterium]
MAKKKKYYVIWHGHETGIFNSWASCQNLIKGFPNAVYKSFPDYKTAHKAYYGLADDYIGKETHKKALSNAEKQRIGQPISNSLAVDAACSGNPGKLEYQGVITSSGQRVFHQGPFEQGTVNIGEFLALVHGLAFLKKHNSHIPVYSDSRTAIKWIQQKKSNTKLPQTSKNEILFDLIERAELWLQNNQWDNPVLKWETAAWGEIPADFGRK